jgi:hypothetical protein
MVCMVLVWCVAMGIVWCEEQGGLFKEGSGGLSGCYIPCMSADLICRKYGFNTGILSLTSTMNQGKIPNLKLLFVSY